MYVIFFNFKFPVHRLPQALIPRTALKPSLSSWLNLDTLTLKFELQNEYKMDKIEAKEAYFDRLAVN